jgi:hypothetical protein
MSVVAISPAETRFGGCTEMTGRQTGTSKGAKTEAGRLTSASSRVRRRNDGVSTKAEGIATIPEPPGPAEPWASAETHVSGPSVEGSGDSRSTPFVPAEPSGRESKRACEVAGDETCDRIVVLPDATTWTSGARSVENSLATAGGGTCRIRLLAAHPLPRSAATACSSTLELITTDATCSTERAFTGVVPSGVPSAPPP